MEAVGLSWLKELDGSHRIISIRGDGGVPGLIGQLAVRKIPFTLGVARKAASWLPSTIPFL